MLLIFWLFCLFPICAASDRLSISFRLHAFENVDARSLTLQVVQAGNPDGNRYIVGHNLGNRTFQGKMSMPWKKGQQAAQLQFIVGSDQFLQKNVIMFVKQEGKTHLKMTAEDFKLQLLTSVDSYKGAVSAKGNNGCGCVKGNCACCETIRLSELKFDHTVCANLSYNAATIGIELAIGVDGHFYILEEISARNPPPLCTDVPWVHEIADVCIAFKNLDISRQHFAGCVEAELELAHLRVAHVPLGCFDMPI